MVQKFFGCQTTCNFPDTFFPCVVTSDRVMWEAEKKVLVECQETGHDSSRVETAFSSEQAQAPAPILSRCFSPCHRSAEVSAAFMLCAAEHWFPTGLPREVKACRNVPTTRGGISGGEGEVEHFSFLWGNRRSCILKYLTTSVQIKVRVLVSKNSS